MGTFAVTIWRFRIVLIKIFNFFLMLFAKDAGIHKSRFARGNEIIPFRTPIPTPNSLLLGTLNNGDFIGVHATKTRPELGNMLINAPTRAGKGLLAISQLLTWDSSVIVNDMKGELYEKTSPFRRTLGPVIVIDPEGNGNQFDPFYKDQTEDDFINSATHLLVQGNEGRDDRVFTDRAINMLVQMLLASRIEQIPPLLYIRYLVRMGLSGAAAHLNAVDPELATQFLETNFSQADLKDKFLMSCWGTLTPKMRPLIAETVIRSLLKSDFTPEDIMCGKKPVTVYLRWPERKLFSLSPLVRLLWGTITDELLDIYDAREKAGRKEECRPVLLLIDEAGRTAIPMLAELSSTCAGRGISLWMAIQSLSQLEIVYGRARAQELRDNMDTQIYYRPTDIQTANYLQERLGPRSALAFSQTLRDGEETSEGRSERPIPLLATQDIMQLADEDIIAFHHNLPPMQLRRIDFRGRPYFEKRISKSAQILPQLPPIPQMALAKQQIVTTDLKDPDSIGLQRNRYTNNSSRQMAEHRI